MISHGVEISISGGGADEKDGAMEGSLFFFLSSLFLYHVFVVKYKKQHGALAMAETKL